MSGFYHVTVGSLPDYEELVAEIYISDKFVALISQEQGPEKFVLELAQSECTVTKKMDLTVFERAVLEAKEKLRKLKRAENPG